MKLVDIVGKKSGNPTDITKNVELYVECIVDIVCKKSGDPTTINQKLCVVVERSGFQ